jgi:ABC-type sugar transport system ATPase subunit
MVQPDTTSFEDVVLGLDHVSKHFGSITALDDVSLRLYPGEVLAVVGDNGAGKSTMVRLLSGVYRPDSGQIVIKGQPTVLQSPDQVIRAGVATVFQDLALVEPLNVAKNVFLGHEPSRFGWVHRRKMEHDADRLFSSLVIKVPAMTSTVAMLSGGQRQGVAIARGVLQGGRAVLMDEPTAALGVRETARVREIIGGLREQGLGVLVVSHDLDFVFQVADRLHVMRLGRTAGVTAIKNTTREDVVHMITGTSRDAGEYQDA